MHYQYFAAFSSVVTRNFTYWNVLYLQLEARLRNLVDRKSGHFARKRKIEFHNDRQRKKHSGMFITSAKARCLFRVLLVLSASLFTFI